MHLSIKWMTRKLALLCVLGLFGCGDVAWEYSRYERTVRPDGSMDYKLTLYNVGAESIEEKTQETAWSMLTNLIDHSRTVFPMLMNHLDPGGHVIGGRCWVESGSMNLEYQIHLTQDLRENDRWAKANLESWMETLKNPPQGMVEAILFLSMMANAVEHDKGDHGTLVTMGELKETDIVNTNGSVINIGEGKRAIVWPRSATHILFTIRASKPKVEFASRAYARYGLNRNLR